MAHLLAEHGARVSLITTPVNEARIKPIIDRVKETNLPVQFIELTFPSAQFGLPEGCESVELTTYGQFRPFIDAIYSHVEPLECFLKNLDSRPDCMITDMCNGWTGSVARKFGIPRVIFHGPCCFYISASHNLEIHKVFDCISNDNDLVNVPDFPVKLEVNKAQTPGFLNYRVLEDIRRIILEEESTASGVVINTFDELERPFIEQYEKAEMVDEVKQWLSEGFEERTKDRGLILVGWAPQLVILSHPAIGGFMIHCGWNSMVEAISMGVPLITWPHFDDQFVNENLDVNVLKIGISLGVKTPNYGGGDVVHKDGVRSAVLALMDKGEERRRAKDFVEKAKKAMEEGGSSYVNMTDMIRYSVDLGSKMEKMDLQSLLCNKMSRTSHEKGRGREEPKAHFVLVPFAPQGHTIPMIDMAHLLAERGVHVSLITTPANAARVKPIIDRVKKSNLPIQFVELTFPSARFGLPEGCESLEHFVIRPELARPFLDDIYSLDYPLECFLQNLDSRPDCMIIDMCSGWAGPVARKFGIPRMIFHGPCCFYISAAHNLEIHKVYDRISDNFESVVVPNFPIKLEVNKAQTPGFFGSPISTDLRKIMLKEESMAEAVVINTFDELERSFIKSYEKVTGKRVWAIGPLCLYNKDVDMRACHGSKESDDHLKLVKWLDGRDPASVLYVNFGSVAYTNSRQLIEIGNGLEASKRPFIWVIKKAEITNEVKYWLAEGFEERTKDRGFILVGWASQMVILSNPAIGGFMTHCGWNSVIEAVCMGVPMITWPHFADQFVNENFIVDVLKIGVSLGVKMPNFGSPDVTVLRDGVKSAVLALMDGGDEGEERRKRAKDFTEKAKKAMEEGGSSFANVTDMIRYFAERENKKDEENELLVAY
ncbi:hypothetical protein LUZ60_009663 [Juncus effusus]|nr:hypothetical protein LUZ60_009663 [Juncus effusus]